MVLIPFTCLSLACSIIQFTDFATKILNSKDTYDSARGVTKGDEILQTVRTELHGLSQHIIGSSFSQGTETTPREKEIQKIAHECARTAQELIVALQSVKPNRLSYSKNAFVYNALCCVWSKQKIEELRTRLNKYRGELAENIIKLTRY